MFLQSTPYLHDESFAQVVLDCVCVGFGFSVGAALFALIVWLLVRRQRAAAAPPPTVAPVRVPAADEALTRAMALLDAGELDAAIAALGDVAVRSPVHAAVAHLRLGSAWRRKRDADRAIGHLRRARELGASEADVAIELEAAERVRRGSRGPG